MSRRRYNYGAASNTGGWKLLSIVQLLISIALAIVIVCAVGSEGFTKKDVKTWFSKDQEQSEPNGDEQKGDDKEDLTDLQIEFEALSYGNLLSDSAMSAALLNEPMPLATSGDVLTVTATVKHADGSACAEYYQAVTFEGIGSDFDEYFNLSVSGNTATVTCNKAFHGPREFKCTSVFFAEATKTFSMTYAKRPKTMGVNFGDYEGGTVSGFPFYAMDSANVATLKLSDLTSIYNDDWQTARIKLLDSIEMGVGSTANNFVSYKITVTIPDELKTQLQSNFSILNGDNYGTYTIGYPGLNPSNVFTSDKVPAISQYTLFDGVFGGHMQTIWQYSNGQVMTSFMNMLITYSQTGGYSGGTTALFNVSVEVQYSYGGTNTCNYEIFADFCDVSQITFNDDNSDHVF